MPADQAAELKAAFDEFEEGKTPEAKFAHAMDNLQPLLLNDSNAGGIGANTASQRTKSTPARAATAQGSKALFAATEEILQKYIDNGTLPDERRKKFYAPVDKARKIGYNQRCV